MKLVVGLGNIGKEYELTRHNIGFIALDSFAHFNDFGNWKEDTKLQCYITKKDGVILIKPTTFMNQSGVAVSKVASYYSIAAEDVLLVYDDKDIVFKTLQHKIGGSSAGHNGIKSLPKTVQESSQRLRIGVKNDHTDATDTSAFVLSRFNKEELSYIDESLLEEINQHITKFVQ